MGDSEIEVDMTNKEILTKVIYKAKQNGWNFAFSKQIEKWLPYKRYYTLIFDHSFAKAFWGENCWLCDKGIKGHSNHDKTTSWQHHLKQMVLEEDPIKYLEKFV